MTVPQLRKAPGVGRAYVSRSGRSCSFGRGCAIDDEACEIRTQRVAPQIDAIVAWVLAQPGPVAVTYEARPTGFGLARALAAVGVRCEMVAPLKRGGHLGQVL